MSTENAVHPGEVIKQDCLEPLGLSVTDAAKAVGITRANFSKILNGRSGVSPEMAIRLSKAFGHTPEFWLRLQMEYDLTLAQSKADSIKVERYELKSRRETPAPTPA